MTDGGNVTLSVTNLTEETLELDAATGSPGFPETAPRDIPKHGAARFAAPDSETVTFLIGGDPDRPVFIQIGDASCNGHRIDVWAPPVYAVEVHEAEAGGVAVSVAPSRHRVRAAV